MDGRQPEESRVGLEEVDRETEGEVAHEEGAEAQALAMRPLREAQESGGGRNQERDLVELGGVAAHAVAEIDAPGERGRDAVGAVGEPVEIAPDAADRHRDGQWDREQVARSPDNPEAAFGPLHGDRAAEQATHDCLALEPRQHDRARCRPEHGRNDHPAAVGVAEEVARAPPLAVVECKSDGVRQRFEREMDKVGVQRRQAYQTQVGPPHGSVRSLAVAVPWGPPCRSRNRARQQADGGS